MDSAALNVLWANCVERLKDRSTSQPFWEALENCKPITLEDGVLILGLSVSKSNLMGYLQQSANQHIMREVTQELFNQNLVVRVIEGDTADDWSLVKARELRVAAIRSDDGKSRMVSDRQAEGWDGLYEQIARLYAQSPMRAMPQGKARYANEALYVVSEAMDNLYGAQPDEIAERGLARVLERIANASDIPASVLAFELERLRAWRVTNSAN